jgi:CheY-like chemotaxis protein
MFSQVHGSRGSSKDRGLGIGLHLVKRLIELHGGRVTAFSRGEDLGSEFRIELPLSSGTPATVLHAPAQPVSTSLRILVVDDNRDAAESMSTLLASLGHEVKTAFDGREALEATTSWRPDLLFLDIGMPDMDGYEVARRVRSATLDPQPFIVAVSGWGQPEDRRKTAEAGFDRHLVKPVEMSEVHEVIAWAAASRRDPASAASDTAAAREAS